MKSIEQIVEEFKSKFIETQYNLKGGIGYYEWSDNDYAEDAIYWLTQTLQAERQKRDEMVEKYDEIFKWLLGEKGDFPDLSKKPHYSFRTELRERLQALTLPNNPK